MKGPVMRQNLGGGRVYNRPEKQRLDKLSRKKTVKTSIFLGYFI